MPKIVISSYTDPSSEQGPGADKPDMTHSRALAAVTLSLLLLIAAAPSAFAQDLPGTGDVTGATGTVTETVDETTDSVTDAVDDASGGATTPVTDTVDNTTDDTTDTVNDTAGNTTGSVTETVNQTTGGGDTNGGTDGGSLTETVTNTVNETLGGGSGSGGSDLLDSVFGGGGNRPVDTLTPDLVDDLVDRAAPLGLSPVAAEGWIEGTTLGSRAYQEPAFLLGAISGLLEEFAGALTGTNVTSLGGVEFSTTSSGSSLFSNAARVAIEAAKTLAFPLVLALVVVGFLAIQGRIGRKDPKLALAPVDTDEEYLAFE